MFPFQGHLGYPSDWPSHQSGFVQEHNWPGTLTNSADLIMSSTSGSKVEKKSTSEACKSHKEAERRRRQRINAHLSTLRTLLPSTIKTDKASLLAEVVHHLKELRSQAADVVERDWNSCWSGSSSGSEMEFLAFPGESDELTLIPYCDNGIEERHLLIKATLCCEDRPGLNLELTRAISIARARAIRAEMMTIGGRIKSVVVIECEGGGGIEAMAVLQRALKAVVENRFNGYGLGRVGTGNKRARVGGLVNECDHDEEAFVTRV